MTLVLVFRHLCPSSDRISYNVKTTKRYCYGDNSIHPSLCYLSVGTHVNTTHRGWRLLQTVARFGEHELLDILREIYLLNTTTCTFKHAMKRINIKGNLMYVIWYNLFFKKLQAPCFSFFIFFWRRASPPHTACRQAP